jgi:hypothetical protein
MADRVQRDNTGADAAKPSGGTKSAVAGAIQTEGEWEEF